jgi:HEAT repeat protein
MCKPTIPRGIVVTLRICLCMFAWAGVGSLALWPRTARADQVDDLIRKLESDPDYKVRLSAALNLGKIGDPRAVGALIDALGDADKTVRGVAAAALGKVVDSATPADTRERAVQALGEVAANDPERSVRAPAQKSYDTLRSLAAPPQPQRGGVFVEVGPMTDGTKQAPALVQTMRKTVADTLTRKAPGYQISAGTLRLSDADARRLGQNAFYVDGTLTQLSVQRSQVSCSVSMLLATYPQKSMFGFMKGGAQVDAGSTSQRAITEATNDCVGAVLEDLVTTKVVPTIRARTGQQ